MIVGLVSSIPIYVYATEETTTETEEPVAVVATDTGTGMKTSDNGIAYIKSVEGFSKYPYYDYGQYTVGYGTRCPGDKYYEYKENGITDAEAEALLREFLEYTESEIRTKLIEKHGLTMTQSQFDALVSFSFNVGTSWMSPSKTSTLKTAILNNGTPNDIIYAFSLYCNAGGSILQGLVTRRLCEANMYLNGVYSRNRDTNIGYVFYDANGGTVKYKIQGFLTSAKPAPILNATCDGHTFMGWYTKVVGGTKVTKLTSDLVGQTLFAHWDTEDGVDVNPMEPVTVTVSQDEVNVRTGPGTSYDKIGQANQGEKLVITRVINGTSVKWGQFDRGWISLYYTNYDDVISGNANKDESQPTEPEQPDVKDEEQTVTGDGNSTKIGSGTITASSLRIRSGPGTTYETLGYLYNGNKVEIFETKEINGVTWGRIGVGKWVSMSYVKLDKTTEDSTEKNEETTQPSTPAETPTQPSEPEEPTPTTKPTEPTEPTEPTKPIEPEDTTPPTTEPPATEPPVTEPTTPPQTTEPSKPKEEQDTSKPADTTQKVTGKVKVSSSLRVRKGPGTNYETVDMLYNGHKVTILEQKVNGTMTWGRIGTNRWISMTYVVLDTSSSTNNNTNSSNSTTNTNGNSNGNSSSNNSTNSSNQSQAVTGTVTASSLRIRQNAGTTYKTLGYLPKGTKVKITEQKKVGNMTWGKIDSGWISMSYVKIDNATTSTQNKEVVKTVTASSLRIRQNAGTSYKTVGYLKKGDKVTILETKTVGKVQWGRISKGWISLAYTK
jgi:GH24 family phage-related lysozyme (muramidase)/uncharacterized protein YgiM (DUF1202 family)